MRNPLTKHRRAARVIAKCGIWAALVLATFSGLAATVNSNNWIGQWSIPLNAAGINPSRSDKILFNVAVRRPAQGVWVLGADTGSSSWELGNAGELSLIKPARKGT